MLNIKNHEENMLRKVVLSILSASVAVLAGCNRVVEHVYTTEYVYVNGTDESLNLTIVIDYPMPGSVVERALEKDESLTLKFEGDGCPMYPPIRSVGISGQNMNVTYTADDEIAGNPIDLANYEFSKERDGFLLRYVYTIQSRLK